MGAPSGFVTSGKTMDDGKTTFAKNWAYHRGALYYSIDAPSKPLNGERRIPIGNAQKFLITLSMLPGIARIVELGGESFEEGLDQLGQLYGWSDHFDLIVYLYCPDGKPSQLKEDIGSLLKAGARKEQILIVFSRFSFERHMGQYKIDEVCDWADANGIAYSDNPIPEDPVFNIQEGEIKSILEWAGEMTPDQAEDAYDAAVSRRATADELKDLAGNWGVYCASHILKKFVFDPLFLEMDQRMGTSHE